MRAVCLLRKVVVISARASASVIDIKRSTTLACIMFVAQLKRNPLRHTDFSYSLSCCHYVFLLFSHQCVYSQYLINQFIVSMRNRTAAKEENVTGGASTTTTTKANPFNM